MVVTGLKRFEYVAVDHSKIIAVSMNGSESQLLVKAPSGNAEDNAACVINIDERAARAILDYVEKPKDE